MLPVPPAPLPLLLLLSLHPTAAHYPHVPNFRLPIPGPLELFWSWAGAFIGILAVSALNEVRSPVAPAAATVRTVACASATLH